MAASPVLLITGASRGIGAAAAKLAGVRGFDVAVNYVSNRDAADSVVAAIKAAGRRSVAVQADMRNEEDIARMFVEVDEKLGRLTHLVYNTGVTGPMSRVETIEAAALREVLDVNVLGAFLCVKAAISRISTRHGGRGGVIVLLSSAMATIGGAGEYVCYAASKAAIECMTVGLARELVQDGIRVNAVAPGPVQTDIHAPGRLDKLIAQVPLGRAGSADEIAEAILFMLSDQCAFTDGAVLRVAGAR
jgi:NAD(P)-dependent dehydrogenase (short-subunit alcohol dehydrogenase family)